MNPHESVNPHKSVDPRQPNPVLPSQEHNASAIDQQLLADEFEFDTRAVRAGQTRSPQMEHNDPLHLTSSFVFESASQAHAAFVEQTVDNVYSRFSNPTVRTFEQRLASLERGRHCVATSSGMAAITMTAMATLQSGDHVVASESLFGTSVTLFKRVLSRFGVSCTFVKLTDLQQWRDAITDQTKMLFVETPSNPLCEIVDLTALAQLSRSRNCRLVVDNCFCTPALQQPLTLGADIVIHSATKYLDGQGRCVGGAIVTNDSQLNDDLVTLMRSVGACMSAFNAWVFINGLETLNIRMKAHCENAARVADWLQSVEMVERVYYPGLAQHPQHHLARTQQSGAGGIIAFEVKGGRQQAWSVIDSTRLVSITGNLGDAKTTIGHPATTTHGRISEQERQAAGITEKLIRLSVGLENPVDIIKDLARGLGVAGDGSG